MALTTEIERDGRVYRALVDGAVLWTLELAIEDEGSPFREQLVWGSVVVIGAGRVVHIVDAGVIVRTFSLEDDYFGHLAIGEDALFILGFFHVVAVCPSLTVRWVSRDVAVDGIVWGGQRGDGFRLPAGRSREASRLVTERSAASTCGAHRAPRSALA